MQGSPPGETGFLPPTARGQARRGNDGVGDSGQQGSGTGWGTVPAAQESGSGAGMTEVGDFGRSCSWLVAVVVEEAEGPPDLSPDPHGVLEGEGRPTGVVAVPPPRGLAPLGPLDEQGVVRPEDVEAVLPGTSRR